MGERAPCRQMTAAKPMPTERLELITCALRPTTTPSGMHSGRSRLVRPALAIMADCLSCNLCNSQSDSVGRGLQRIVGEMRIPSSCVHMIMAQQFSNHRKPFAN